MCACKGKKRSFDKDPSITKTTSFPEGLNEQLRFIPNFSLKSRRASSDDDISRYERYFKLVQANHENYFTWNQYLKILRDEWNRLDFLTRLRKREPKRRMDMLISDSSECSYGFESDGMMKKRGTNWIATATSDGSSCTTGQEGEIKVNKMSTFASKMMKKASFYKKKTPERRQLRTDSVESLSSETSNSAGWLTPQSKKIQRGTKRILTPTSVGSGSATAYEDEIKTNRMSKFTKLIKKASFDYKKTPERRHLRTDAVECLSSESSSSVAYLTPKSKTIKEICSETKAIARKICKTVEKIRNYPKYCPSCGANLDSAVHKNCPHVFKERGKEIITLKYKSPGIQYSDKIVTVSSTDSTTPPCSSVLLRSRALRKAAYAPQVYSKKKTIFH